MHSNDRNNLISLKSCHTKIMLTALIFFVIAPTLVEAADPSEQWNKTFGGTYGDGALSVQQTSDGGYIIAGNNADGPGMGDNDAWLIKVDSSGNEQWDKTYGGAKEDIAFSVDQTSDGGYIIAGRTYSYGAGHYDAWILKTDSSGNEQWNKTYGGIYADVADSVQQTSDGGYIIAGRTESYGAGSVDAWLIKVDSSGNEQWNKTFGGYRPDNAYSVQQTSDGGYIIAGDNMLSGLHGSDAWLIKVDNSGNQEWDKTFGISGDHMAVDLAMSVQQTSDGGYIVAGDTQSYGAGGFDVWLIKFDNNGNQQWNETFGGINDDYAYSVKQTSDGGYIIAGTTGPYYSGYAWLIKTDSGGNELWDKTFGGSYFDSARSVQQTFDGGYILAGETLSYGAGGVDAWLIKVAPENNPPVANAGESYQANEGSPVTFDASSSSDPDGNALQYRWDFESDGIWDTQWSNEPVATHAWDDDFSGTAKLEVSDGKLISTDTATVTVNNVNPILDKIVSTVDPVLVNTPVKTSCTFTDAGTKDTHTGTWDWIEGVSSSGSVTESSGAGTVTGEHTYADPGIYRVSLAVTDNNDGTASATAENYIVVYNPEGGFVTGGGWIDSPAGAYVKDTTLEGKATFGFVSKYQKGATVPTGNTEFQFKVADLNFKSTSYDWLVVAGSQAKFKGTGTINGEGNCGFMLSAVDGAVDKFRIKIWDKESNAVIYDNELEVAEDSEPATAVGGGSIIIHTGK